MNLKKFLTLLFSVYIVVLLGLIIANEQFLFIEDHHFWINVVILNLIFTAFFFIMGAVLIHNVQREIKKKDKFINELKGKLYDNIKDDEEREKMIKDFEKSIR